MLIPPLSSRYFSPALLPLPTLSSLLLPQIGLPLRPSLQIHPVAPSLIPPNTTFPLPPPPSFFYSSFLPALAAAGTEAVSFNFSHSLIYLIWSDLLAPLQFDSSILIALLHFSNSASLFLFWYSIYVLPFSFRSYPIFLIHSVLPRFSFVHSLLLQYFLLTPLSSALFNPLLLLLNSDHSAHDPLYLILSALLSRTGSAWSAHLCLLLFWKF